jgi:hypothetical protein
LYYVVYVVLLIVCGYMFYMFAFFEALFIYLFIFFCPQQLFTRGPPMTIRRQAEDSCRSRLPEGQKSKSQTRLINVWPTTKNAKLKHQTYLK